MVAFTFTRDTSRPRVDAILRSMAPIWMGQRGCSYALRVRREIVPLCVAALQRERAVFSKVYCQYADGRREELTL